MLTILVEVGRCETEVHHSYFVHRVFTIFVVSNENIVKFHIVVNLAAVVNTFQYVDNFDPELVDGFVAELHIELIEITIEITSKLLHDVERHKLFSVFNALLDQIVIYAHDFVVLCYTLIFFIVNEHS
jgi:hypothetical protein